MIQRIQTLFLFGIVLLMTLLLFTAIWTKIGEDGSRLILDSWRLNIMDVDGNTSTKDAYYTAIAAILTIALTLVTIFQYKNRMRQMLFSSIISFFIAGTAFSIIFLVRTANSMDIVNGIGGYNWAAWIPLPCFILNTLAKFFIKKDDNLVKSVDRLR